MNSSLDVQNVGFSFTITPNSQNILSNLKLFGYKTRQCPHSVIKIICWWFDQICRCKHWVFFAFERFFNDTPDTGFHESCIHSWIIVGKNQTRPDCPEKADLKGFSSPYPVCNMCAFHLDFLNHSLITNSCFDLQWRDEMATLNEWKICCYY